jgi:two-component system NtrC family sensor kinase
LSKRLLLAVPEPALAEQIANEVFGPAGYDVIRVHDITTLMDALRRGRFPDVLFLSNPLPGGEAFDVAAELRGIYPALPIVMLAGKSVTRDLFRSMQTGLVDYLNLPLDKIAALNAAERALEQKKLWEAWLRRETGRITEPLTQRLSELETLLFQVNDGVLVVDKEQHILIVNLAFRQTFGLGNEDLTGKDIQQVVPNSGLIEALRTRGHHNEVQNQAGRVFDVRVSNIPELGLVASLHDITYLKELDRMKGDFVNTVAHDLRSPLTAILGYVELIERAGKVNAQQTEFINRVKSSVYTTTNLIEDLLKLGRVEIGTLDEVTPVNVKLLLVNTLANYQVQVKQKELTLRVRKSGSLLPVMGSRIQLNQMVDNLIANAVKYTPPGGQIRVTLSEEEHQLILRVADTGPGIPLEEQSRIFEKFYRASNAPEGVVGTGLGLAIVKTIVDNHRGRIWVDSKPGEGAEFTVVLPLAKEKKT